MKLKHKTQMAELRKKLALSNCKAQRAQVKNERLALALEESNSKNQVLIKQKANALKKASKYRVKAVKITEATQGKEAAHEMIEHIEYLENENEQIKEQLEAFLASNEVAVFEGGKYTDEIRSTYMEIMSHGVASNKCNLIVQTVLQNLTNKTTERLPKHTLAAHIRAEAAVLAKIQCGVHMLQTENNTVHIDGTKKKFREFNTVDITTGDGKSLSLGYDEMSGGTTEDYIISSVDIMKEIADLLLPEQATSLQRDCKVAELLFSVRNTMTDRHIVNKNFNEALYDIRKSYMALVKDLEDISDEEMQKLSHMNNLFCSVHAVGNCGTVAKSSLKDFEEMCELPNDNIMKGTARTYQFLFALSKALTYAHDYQRAGVAHYWAAHLKEENVKDQMVSLKGERINILFILGGAAYYHRDHLQNFLKKKVPVDNKLIKALQDLENPVVLAGCRALGILGQLIMDPLIRMIAKTEHILHLNELWEDLLSDLDKFAQDPAPLLQGKGPLCLAGEVHSSSLKHEALFEQGQEDMQNLTKMSLQMMCISMAVLINRQLQDQLPGGTFHKPSPQVLLETGQCPATNIISERDFSHLDRVLKEKPNISTIAATGTIMFLNNKTSNWLKSLPEDQKAQYFETARKKAPELIKKYREKKEQVLIRMSDKMKKKQENKDRKEKKKVDTTEKLLTKVSKCGGLWQTENDVNRALENVDGDEKYAMLADQLKLRKNLNSRKGDPKLYHLTCKSNKLPVATLKSNLITVL
jgi:hypothetical protein